MSDKSYLGDGVYVELADYGLKLTTSNGMFDTNTIHLESDVWKALQAYVKALARSEQSSTVVEP